MFKFIAGTAIWGILVPSLVAGAVLLVAWRPWDDEAEGGHWGHSIGFVLGYAAAHWGLNGDPSTMWYLLAGFFVIGIIESTLFRIRSLVWVSRVAAVPAISYLVAGYMFSPQNWSGFEAFAWPALFTALAVGMVATLEHYADNRGGATVPIVLTMVGTAGAMTFALGTSARVGEMIGAITAMAGASIVLAWWNPRAAPSRGGATVWVLLFTSLAIFGYVGIWGDYQTIVGKGLLGIALAPHLLWLDRIGPIAEMEDWRGTLFRVAVVGLALAGVAAWVYSVA